MITIQFQIGGVFNEIKTTDRQAALRFYRVVLDVADCDEEGYPLVSVEGLDTHNPNLEAQPLAA